MRGALLGITLMGFCAAAHAGEPPKPVAQVELSQLLPVHEDIWASVAFVNDALIAVAVRAKYVRESGLTLLEWKNGELRPIASTRDVGSDVLNLHRAPGGILAVGVTGSAFLYSATLFSMRRIEPVHGVSPSGTIVLRRTKDEWKLEHPDSPEELIRRGHDELLSFSDQVMVLRPKNALQIETFDGRVVGSFRIRGESNCPAHVRILSGDRFYVDNCKDVRIVDLNGNTKLRLPRPKGWPVNRIGFDPVSADGNRFLSVNFSRKLPFLRHAGEILVAVVTFGMGVDDEVDNRQEIRVVDTGTGAVCFDLVRTFPMGWASPFEDAAAISPSGEFVAIAADRHLSIYRLPATCGSRN